MNLLQLVLKQMRQRALSTWLTLLSVMLGMTLVVAVLILRREGESLFGQTDYGFDVLVGPKASPLQLTLNAIYQLDRSPGNIPYALYEKLAHAPQFRAWVQLAVPMALGDSYMRQRIVATVPRMFNVADDGQAAAGPRFEFRPGRSYEFAAGRCFAPQRFEAVIGADVPRLTGLKIGDKFRATHGMPAPNEQADIHDEQWTVVGVLKPTHTASDHVLYIPLTTFYCIFEHEQGLAAQAKLRAGENAGMSGAEREAQQRYALNADGTIALRLPKDEWLISAVLVKSRGGVAPQALMYAINNQNEALAVNPASVMREFFSTFLDNSAKLLLLISCLVTVVAAASILTTIYNSVAARKREIAILRALGATRRRVLTLICVEAGLIGLLGGAAGLLVGHLLSAAGSAYLSRLLGEGIHWLVVGPEEWIYLTAVVLIAALAGLAPALKAYRMSVADNLVAA